MRKVKDILWGLVLIVLGILIFLKVVGLISFDMFFPGWWTLFIIVPCVIGLFCDDNKGFSIFGIVIGVFLLLSSNDVISFDLLWKLILPFVLVFIGCSLVFKNFLGKRSKKNSDNDYSVIFSGQDLNFKDEEFSGASFDAVFGGVKCDLREAVISSDVNIDASCVFGGVDIFLPKNVNVKVKSNSFAGGVTNNCKDYKGKHTVYINAECFFGGVNLK